MQQASQKQQLVGSRCDGNFALLLSLLKGAGLQQPLFSAPLSADPPLMGDAGAHTNQTWTIGPYAKGSGPKGIGNKIRSKYRTHQANREELGEEGKEWD